MELSYYPENLQEALLLRSNTGAVPFAGGTDLMVRYRNWAGTNPEFPWPVLFLNHLDELKTIIETKEYIEYGASVTLTEILEYNGSPDILKKAISLMAAPALRNLGTMAGNIGNASPAGDTLPVLYALGASIVLQSLSGKRVVLINDFIIGPGKKNLFQDEIIIGIRVPKTVFSFEIYRKVGTRKANALTKLSFVGLCKTKNGVIDDIKITFGAVGPTIVESVTTEKRFIGLNASALNNLKQSIIEDYQVLIQPIDDQRSSAEYRKKVSINLLHQFIEKLIKELDLG